MNVPVPPADTLPVNDPSTADILSNVWGTMFWDPSKDTPPISIAVVRVAAEPDHTPPDRVPVPSVILVPDTASVKVPAAPYTSPVNVPVPTADTSPLAVIVVVDKAPIIWASF